MVNTVETQENKRCIRCKTEKLIIEFGRNRCKMMVDKISAFNYSKPEEINFKDIKWIH